MISAIPERIIEQTLIAGLTSLRRNPKALATLFQNLTDPEFQRIVKFFALSPINVSLNYPRQQLKVPAICILLKGEKEAQTFLGDNMEVAWSDDPQFSEHVIETNSFPSPLNGPATKLIDAFNIRSADSSGRVYIDFQDYVTIKQRINSVENLFLYVTGGKGKGKIFPVKAIESGGYIAVGSDVSQILDFTSYVDLRLGGGGLGTGEPKPVFSPGVPVTRRGALYDTTVVLDVLAGSQEEVAFLYYAIKAIIYINRTFLEGQGIINLNISGEDMLIRSEFVPDDIFHRVLRLSFNNPFSILIEDDIIREFQVELC
jgi:hypothetical protein